MKRGYHPYWMVRYEDSHILIRNQKRTSICGLTMFTVLV